VSSLSQLPHWLHQLPTVGKGQCKHWAAHWVYAANPEATGRFGHATGYQQTNSNTRRKHKTEKHNRIDWTHRKKTVGKNIDKVGLQDYGIIWNTPNAEIPKRDFSLLSNPLVLFKRIFRG
jgi:hypothetical protein